jgi:hypothetical protein
MLSVFVAIVLATAGQVLLSRHDLRGLIPYGVAVTILLIVLWREHRSGTTAYPERMGAESKIDEASAPRASPFHRPLKIAVLSIALISAVVAFLGASDNTYRWWGVTAWVTSVILLLSALWERDKARSWSEKLNFSRAGWRIGWTTLVVVAVLLIAIVFRFRQLGDMPSEMTSDHIEKLLDVHDLVTGQRPIFFERNTGREPWQFYWTLGFIRLFDLDTKFLALKLGTAVVSLITLPGVYLLGRDLFNGWVGLWAALFTAVASWSVIISRVGLRFPFAPAMTAWALLFFLRGLRHGRRNDFLLLGVCLGIGLQGYTAFRAMPLAVLLGWVLVFIFQPPSLAAGRSTLLRNGFLTVLIAVVVFIPLGRYSLEHPESFWQRSFSRVADPSQSLADGPFVTFLKNMANLAATFHWQGDDVWVNALINAPFLDPLLGGLLLLGLVIMLWRGSILRDPIPPLLLISGVILLLPSALSLAYPMENPSAVRTGGAIPVVMLITAMPVSLAIELGSRDWRSGWYLQREPDTILRNWRGGLLILGALGLAVAAIGINYRRYFSDYWSQYQQNALNTTEVASAIRGFVESGGDPANAWIIAWPYWIDTRGVGIELGDPPWNNVILDLDELNDHVASSAPSAVAADGGHRPRFYVLHPEDTRSLQRLHTLFPTGWSSLFMSDLPGRSFVLFYVPRRPAQGLIYGIRGARAHAP